MPLFGCTLIGVLDETNSSCAEHGMRQVISKSSSLGDSIACMDSFGLGSDGL